MKWHAACPHSRERTVMHYQKPVYRPPQEAFSPLLPVTYGCSHNKCKFCSMYKNQPFAVSPLEHIEEDLRELAEYHPWDERMHFVGGNAFCLPYHRLIERIELVHEIMPEIRHINMMARVTDITRKTDEQLLDLRKKGVDFLYIGQESGDDEVLARVNKGCTSADILEQCRRLEKAGIDYYFTFLNGVGGRALSRQHAINSAKLFNQLKCSKVGSGSLTLFPDTELAAEKEAGLFDDMSEKERAEEFYTFLEHIDRPCSVSCHHSSVIPVSGHFPEDKPRIMSQLRHAIDTLDESAQQAHRKGIKSL